MYFPFLIGIFGKMTLEIFSIYDTEQERTRVLVVLDKLVSTKYSINILGRAYNEQRVLGVLDQIVNKDILTDNLLKKYTDLSKYCIFTSLPLDLCNFVSDTVLEFNYEGDVGRLSLDLPTDFVKTSGQMISTTWWFDICSNYELLIKACCVYKKCLKQINEAFVYYKGEIKKESIFLKKEADISLCDILPLVREISLLIENVQGYSYIDDRVKEINQKMVRHVRMALDFYKKYSVFCKKKNNEKILDGYILTKTQDNYTSTGDKSTCDGDKRMYKKSNMERIVGIEFEHFCVFVIGSLGLYVIITCVKKFKKRFSST